MLISLSSLRTCSEDEFNCNLVGEDYTQCIKKFKICNHQVKCSNEDQIECPLCDKSFIYCDLYLNNDKCVSLKKICIENTNDDEQLKCASNQTEIANVCNKFRLSQPNRPTTIESITTSESTSTKNESISSTTTKLELTTNSSLDNLIGTTTETANFKLSTYEDEIPSTIDQDEQNEQTTTQTYNSMKTESSTSYSFNLTTESNQKSTTTTSDQSIQTTTLKPSTTKKRSYVPKNILDYSRMFKSDYGGFNFSNYIYKGDSKGKSGKFDYHSFMNSGQKSDDKNSTKNSFFDFSKFMPGSSEGGGGFDYSKYMGGKKEGKKDQQSAGFDYSQYTANQGQSNQTGDYNSYYAKYMGNGQTKDDKQKGEWGQTNYDYSRYKASGLNSQKTKGGSSYQNDVKSGQKNQVKYAKKSYYDYSQFTDNKKSNETKQGQGNYDSYYSSYMNQNKQDDSNAKSDKTKTQQSAGGAFDYSKYMKQYASGASGGAASAGGFDYSQYMKGGQGESSGGYYDYSKYMSGHQGGQQPKGSKSDDLINLTGSKQPTKSFTSYFDYSKWLKPNGNQLDDTKTNPLPKQREAKNLSLKKMNRLKLDDKLDSKTFHKASYIKNFKEEIIKMQEDNQDQIKKRQDLSLNEGKPQIANQLNEPITTNQLGSSIESEQQLTDPNLEKEQFEKQGYHHIEMQNQEPQYRPTKMNNKEPSVNVSKILPNAISNKYNYTHYGSGVFFINFGTIINGNNNIHGSGKC